MVPDDQRKVLLRCAVFVLWNIESVLSCQAGIGEFASDRVIKCSCSEFCDVFSGKAQRVVLEASDFPRCDGEIGFIDARVAERCDLHGQDIAFHGELDAVIFITDADFTFRCADQVCAVVQDVEIFCCQAFQNSRVLDGDLEGFGSSLAVADTCVGDDGFNNIFIIFRRFFRDDRSDENGKHRRNSDQKSKQSFQIIHFLFLSGS